MRIAWIAGPALLALPLVLNAPPGLPPEAWRAAGLALFMAAWWLTEPVPLAVTALFPLAFAPLLGLADLAAVAASYANPLVFLFLGGFLLARAIEDWGLHRRIATALLARAGTSPGAILAALMGAAAFLSLWISNTASAMVMAPIAGSVAAAVADRPRFATALMLGVAYAATIGGMGSLIGTPPNAVFAAYLGSAHGVQIGFAQWALVGIPVAAVLLAAAWLVLARLTPGLGAGPVPAPPRAAARPLGPGARRVGLIAGLTALAWIARPLLDRLLPGLALSDAGIAVLAAIVLFLAPSGEGSRRLLSGDSLRQIRWDVLILFGGGLALAQILEGTGLAEWIGAQTLAAGTLPGLVTILAAATVIVLVGELASNTAMAAIFLPIGGAAALTLGIDPVLFLLPIALAASVGFMLPVATPPNAIVLSHPSVNRAAMLRAGAPLDAIGVLLAVGLSSLIAPLVF